MSQGIQIIDPEERFTLEVDGSKLIIRRIDSAALMAIERGRLSKSGREDHKANDEILDYVLVDWEQVTSPMGGVEVPCTRENKLKLPASVKVKILNAAQRSNISQLLN